MAADTATPGPAASPTSRWLLPGLLAVAFAAAYWPTLAALNTRWLLFDEAYSHGYLVLGMVVYFVWLQRPRLLAAPRAPRPVWAFAIAALSAVWVLGQIVDIQLLGSVTLPLAALACVLAVYGTGIARIVAFPILLLYVAIPLWEDLFNIPLRSTTTVVAMWWLEAFAPFSAHNEGYAITIPEGVFYVADGCSGLAFFLTGITIGLAYGYLNIDGVARRAAYLVICVLLSIVSNWVRVTSLIYIGHYTHMQSSLVTEGHLMYGWFVFAAVMVLMLVIGYRMSSPLPPESDTPAPITHSEPPLRALVPVVAAVLLAPVLLFTYRALPLQAPTAPALPPAFVAYDAPDSEWHAFFHGDPVRITGALASEPALRVVMLHYPVQSQDKELVNSTNRLIDEPKWRIVEQAKLASDDVGGLPHPLVESELAANDGQHLLVWHWNDLGGIPSTGNIGGKLAQLRATLLHGRPDGTFVAFVMRCDETCEGTRARMRELAPSHIDAFTQRRDTKAPVQQ